MTFEEIEEQGGEFDRTICKAFRIADADNLRRLECVFPHIAERFQEWKSGKDGLPG